MSDGASQCWCFTNSCQTCFFALVFLLPPPPLILPPQTLPPGWHVNKKNHAKQLSYLTVCIGKHINQPTHSSREPRASASALPQSTALWQVEGHCSTEQALWSQGKPPSQIRGPALILQRLNAFIQNPRALYCSLNKDTFRSVRHQLDKQSFRSHRQVSQLGHSQGVSAVHSMPQCIAQIRRGKRRNRLKSHFALCLAPQLHSPLVMII